jgi:hypothetical protein
MAANDTPPSFSDFKRAIESSSEPQRTQWVQRFAAHYLQPGNDQLRAIVRREFFE